MLLLLGRAALAQEPAGPVGLPAPPDRVRELVQILQEPGVRAWLEQQITAPPAADIRAAATPAAQDAAPTRYMDRRLAIIRGHLAALAAAIPQVPGALAAAWTALVGELAAHGLVRVVLLMAAFIGLGFGVELLFWLATVGLRQRLSELELDTLGGRLRVAAMRFAFGLGLVASFALGSIGAFLAFQWPPLLRAIVLGYLLAALAVRLSLVLGRLFLAPGSRPPLMGRLLGRIGGRGVAASPAGEAYYRNFTRFRLVPMSTPAASFWHRRLGLLSGWFAVGWVTVGLLADLGVPLEVRRLVAYGAGLGLLALGLEAVWRRPRAGAAPDEADRLGAKVSPALHRARPSAADWLFSGYLVALWLLWVAGAMPSFWLAVVAVGLPGAIVLTQRAVKHLLRPAELAGQASALPRSATIATVCLERGLRALLIVGAAALLAWAWEVDIGALAARDTMRGALVAGLLNVVVIALVADFLWHLARAAIDRQIERAAALARSAGTPETQRHARLRTLLPILRNVLFIVMLATAALMALSALGVQIGPLLAGAGVVGVAIGFGAQTLVKDIISGMFFLLDDAFRVGEYVESGDIRGTVEAFSLRSVKLRHHRGYLHTVPFGSLEKITNYSRDWVIDKVTIGVTYDTDLDKTRRIIKQIGKELAADPELRPHILETLKMQGVEEYGDYAVKLRLKMMTKPGEQFVIRRRAYAMIKQAFSENGIKFAFPTVQVAGGDATGASAAQAALQLAQPPAAA